MLCALSIAALLAAGAPSGDEPPEAAEERPWSLDLTIDDFGIGIGNSRHVDGLRLNFRDTAPFTVHGVNATVWTPGEGAKGTVDGVALGLPATGASVIRGLALGFGFGADREIDGLGIAILGGGSGGALRGVFAGGLGFGAGGTSTGSRSPAWASAAAARGAESSSAVWASAPAAICGASRSGGWASGPAATCGAWPSPVSASAPAEASKGSRSPGWASARLASAAWRQPSRWVARTSSGSRWPRPTFTSSPAAA